MIETRERPAGLSDATRERLMGVSVATLCTALYKRGLRNQTIQDVRPVAPRGRNMVGPAFTLRYIPAREDLNQVEVFRNPDHPQRVAVERCPTGAVLVMDSRKDPRAASAGGILVTRLMVRGVAGVERRDAREIVGVIGDETAHPGEAADVDRDRRGRIAALRLDRRAGRVEGHRKATVSEERAAAQPLR